MPCSSQHRGQREDVAHVVVDDQHLLAGQRRGSSRAASSTAWRFASGSVARAAVQEEVAWCRAAARRERASRSANAPSARFQAASVAGVLPAPYSTIGSWRDHGLLRRAPRRRSSGCRSATPSLDHHAVDRLASQRLAELRRAVGDDDRRRRRRRARATSASRCAPSAPSAAASVLLGARRRSAAAASSAASSTSLRCIGLATKPIAPESSARSRESSVEIDADRDVPRRQVVLEPVEDRASPRMSGRKMSSVITDGLVLARQRQRAGAACA